MTPAEQRVDPAGSGVLRFEVRVEPVGPVVESDDDGWTFREGD